MPPHEEDYRNGFTGGQLFIKDENGQYTPFTGIQDCTATIAAELDEDGQEWAYDGIDWAADNSLTFTLRQTKQQFRRTTKWLKRIGNHARRIKRHEKRLQERARRSVLKRQDWFVLRDKDGGQVCIDWHKQRDELGRFFVRYKRKRVRQVHEDYLLRKDRSVIGP